MLTGVELAVVVTGGVDTTGAGAIGVDVGGVDVAGGDVAGGEVVGALGACTGAWTTARVGGVTVVAAAELVWVSAASVAGRCTRVTWTGWCVRTLWCDAAVTSGLPAVPAAVALVTAAWCWGAAASVVAAGLGAAAGFDFATGREE